MKFTGNVIYRRAIIIGVTREVFAADARGGFFGRNQMAIIERKIE